ncbi:MAG: chaperone NapD [Colwellia sp.]|nr:chaperone NapD [Colwellia sp.]
MTQNSDTRPSEYHVASLVASCILKDLEAVKKAITEVDDTEIHATSAEGKIVFTIEGTSYKDIDKKIDIIRVHTGILNLSPVYHQVLDEDQERKLAESDKADALSYQIK